MKSEKKKDGDERIRKEIEGTERQRKGEMRKEKQEWEEKGKGEKRKKNHNRITAIGRKWGNKS